MLNKENCDRRSPALLALMSAMEEEEGQVKQSDITIQEEAIRVQNPSQDAEYGGATRRWLEIAAYAVFILAGQTAATILGRLYYERGGNSKWMGTLVQLAGFPILIPFLFIKQTAPPADINGVSRPKPPSRLVLTVNYLLFGLLLAGASLLYSVGMAYLPVSTFTLISASQLGFNALFAFFMKSQTLTPLIINSIFLLTISPVLLFFQPRKVRTHDFPHESDSDTTDKKHFLIGSICTLMGSALFGLALSAGQIILNKFLKKNTLKDVLDLIIIQSFVATCAVIVGLFASGEWKTLRNEMKQFQLGEVSYVMTLVWTALCWEMFTVGVLGLMLKVSGLFANVIIMLSVPVIPAVAVVVLHDEMNGVKVVSMVLAVWGFLSFAYQQYLDEMKMKDENGHGTTPSEVPLVERGHQA